MGIAEVENIILDDAVEGYDFVYKQINFLDRMLLVFVCFAFLLQSPMGIYSWYSKYVIKKKLSIY